MAGSEIGNGFASCPTEISPWESWSSMARLVGSERAEKTASRRVLVPFGFLPWIVEFRITDDRIKDDDFFFFKPVQGVQRGYFAFWLTIAALAKTGELIS